ncbi:hypothetical protein HYFRA_00006854 [Hymenoscyphus fraxineus]|uniref:Large ribosomal subunit protein mL59 domain-containing protein n=1 Tax=Hymenoscyphus fraxineus TaxID=746836 RepID=A0A9N9PKV2_9HELO|nr:hypothetical protein HYFRA_00006854 [Hymenoscyphus fraxineus]
MSLPPQEYIKLAQKLPPRLLQFFARYPTRQLAPHLSSPTPSSASPASPASSESSESPKREINFAGMPYENPFQRAIDPHSGKHQDPKFSLRRQADLAKLARKYGVEELLPFTVKNSQEKLRRRVENGLRVKGTGIGQRVKGKEAERSMKGRLEKRKQAMLDMPQMIQTWKQRGHGRGWKQWPK